ncbi:MAG: putative Coenzyme PQQ synthesis protein D [Candidatus Nitrospira kreftii]|uniref:Putative Coenzyme PQQ synthesis protein D n=1 Tax=Candidatus Nitrospira kreftii TaxID=2652173 RepID=A0A7S8FEW2_9BACT|nr:MAG: putative Coenzyme PQQ synthesis protein D [Candidatus Nitrospira kreftii]
MNLATIRPRLSRKARLRFDRRTSRHLLVYPETGLELNDTATAIVRLCTGERTIEDMVDHLARAYDQASPGEIRRAVCEFLGVLGDRCLLRGMP